MKPSPETRTLLVHGVILGCLLFACGPARAQAPGKPQITVDPSGASVTAGSAITLTVAATGDEPLAYQWRRDGLPLAATNTALPFTNVQTFQSGSYDVVVTNALGGATSAVAVLTVKYSPDFLWARQAGSTNDNEEAYAVAADAAGNVYIAGTFMGTTTFGTNVLTALGGPGWGDMFLAKYSRDGEVLWVRQAGNVWDDGASALAVDNAGNVYVAGWYETNITFGATVLTNYSSSLPSDSFLAKYDPDGNVLWARKVGGGANYDYPDSIALAADGSVALTGYFEGPTGYFGSYTFGGYGDAEMFVARFSPNGGLLWAGFGTSTGYDRGEGVTVDAAGNTYVAGIFHGPAFNFFNGTVLSELPGYFYTPFVAKYNPNGGMIWAKPITNIGFPWDIKAVSSNGVWVVGDKFGLARMDASGNELLVQSAGGDYTAGRAATLDASGNVYVAGVFYGTNITFPDVTFTNGPTTNILVAAGYDGQGNYRWARQFGGSRGAASGLSVDPAGRIYVAGSFSDTGRFGTNLLTSSGGLDIFVGRLGVLPPVLLTLPADATVFTGESNTFAVLATGELPLQYQWRTNGVDVPGATNAAVLVANAQLSDAGAYSVFVSNAFGVAESPAALLTVRAGAPVILTQPQSQIVLGGTTAVLSVLATNSLPLAYQWQQAGADLPGATLATLAQTNVGAAQRGDYQVIVTNLYGAATSDVATLTIHLPPVIVTQPANQTVPAGSDASFAVEAVGDDVLSYQWQWKGQTLSGATASSLVITNAQLAQQGAYSVMVTNTYGSVLSGTATLVVNAPPTITAQPTGQTVPAGTNVTFSVAATGSPVLRYQWRLDGTPLSTATRSSLSLSNVQAASQGNYTVVVTNDFGAQTSSPAPLTVLPSAPWIVSQPRSFTTNVGAAGVGPMTVTALGSQPLFYQWLHAGTNLPSATRTALAFTNVQFSQDGAYSVRVTNAYGSVTSSIANLEVTPGFEWARRIGGGFDDSAVAVGGDAQGGVYVAGSFMVSATLDGTNLTSRGGSDGYVAKYDASGSLLWVWPAGGLGADAITGLAVTPAGDVFVAGTFTGSADFSGTNLTSIGVTDMFVARLDTQGTLLWVQTGWSTSTPQPKAISADGQGGCCVAGAFTGTLNLGGTNLVAVGGQDVFVARLDPAGAAIWAASGGGVYTDYATSVAADAAGNVFVTGSFERSATFGSVTLNSYAGYDRDLFVLKYNAAGQLLWGRRAGSNGIADAGNAIAADSEGGVYVTGQFAGSASFGNLFLGSWAGKTNLFLARYSAAGDVLWVRAAGTTNRSVGNGLATDAAGNAYVTGVFDTNCSFGKYTLAGAGLGDAFVAQFDAAGTAQWARKMGSPRSDTGRAVASVGGSVLVAGDYQTNLVFDTLPGTLTNAGGFDGFVAKLAVSPPETAPAITTSPASHTDVFQAAFALTAGFRGTGPWTYQWFHDGAPVPGATNSMLWVPSLQYSDLGQYVVTAATPYGAVTSAPALVTLEIPPDFAWAKKGGGAGIDEARAVAVDGAGTVYVAGRFGPSATFGARTLTATGNTNLFLVTYDPNGTVLEARQVSGTGAVIPTDLKLDAQTNLWLVGRFGKAADFGGQWITNTPYNYSAVDGNAFVAKYDRAGNLLWVKQPGDRSVGWATSVALDAAGNGHVAGSFSSPTAQFDGIVLTNSGTGSSNSFVARYDPAGQVVWAARLAGYGNQASGVAVDAGGNVYVTGSFFGWMSFGGGVGLTNNATFYSMIFIAKYDSAGVLQWARPGTSSGVGVGQRLAVDPEGNLIATGYKTDYGTSDLVTKLDPDGNVLWSRQTVLSCCTGGYVSGNGLAVDSLGNAVVCGEIYSSAYFDDLYLNGGSYVAKYGSDGKRLWLKQGGGTANALALDAARARAFVVGRFNSTAAFGTNSLTASATDAFVARLSLWEPALALQPQVQALSQNSNLVLQAAAGGSPPLAYQWFLNGIGIAGATGSSLLVPNAQFSNAGVYSVQASNTAGAVSRLAAILNILPRLAVSRSNDTLLLTWSDGFELESAPAPSGPYARVANASSPWPVSLLSPPAAFYRLASDTRGRLYIRLNQDPSAYGVTVAGTPGQTYVVEASTDLHVWTPMLTNVTPCVVPETNALDAPTRFYRSRLLR